ncbi:uncharacterized protein BDV17DRAFT_255141 [Aspergillus undulatus]|uniref:uncharacterized protein n=1 Tax=Aspergillus undulatus TaxID=1810928 RepID=UPI003CCE47A1
MPPTVFSYWRRRSTLSDHSKVLGSSGSSPPQLPLIASDSTLTASFDEKFTAGEVLISHASNFDGGKPTAPVSTIDAPSASTAASPSLGDNIRSRSSLEEADKEPSTFTAQPNLSHPSLTPETPDQTLGSSSKPTSPFRTYSAQDRLNPKAVDGQSRSSISPGMAPSGHRRFRTSLDESPKDKLSISQRESRFEGPMSRRPVERDVQPVEPVPQKSGKTMLHLLNPMSLLAKRRSHQVAALRAEDVNKGSKNIVPAIPDDYDPRIRGNIIHDFSAPRPRRQLSAAPDQISPPGPSSATQLEYSSDDIKGRTSESKSPYSPLSEPGKKHSDRSPVLKEHFEDDKRALQVENKAYLQSSLLTDPSNRDRNPNALPVFARKLPSSITENDKPLEEPAAPSQESKPGLGSEVEGANDDSIKRTEDSDTVEFDLPQQLSGLPKHFKSNASRFSFDLSGVGSSTQEKLLEEKHKEKEAERKAQARLNGEFSDVEDDYDNDMFDDMDGLEEEIPYLDVDDEDDEFKSFSGPGNVLNKSWLAPNLSPIVASPVQPEVPTLQDDKPNPLKQEEADDIQRPLLGSSAYSDHVSDSSKTFLRETRDVSNVPEQSIDDMYFDDGEFGELDVQVSGEQFDESIFDDPTSQLYDRKPPTAPAQQMSNIPLQPIPDEDDLYFDDGEFGDLEADEAGDTFDESIFDDPTSHLYERKQPTASAQPQIEASIQADSGFGLKHFPSNASEHHQGFAPRRYGSVAGNMPNPELANSHSGILSEHNLEAFHNALADAANQSAAKSRLGHTTSVSERSMAQESAQTADSQPGLISDESRISQAMDMVSLEEVFEDFAYDDNDELLYDDPIIAAANAEALENDDEGFYGHEFGFYAQANGHGSELTNGGYFGPRGAEGISRSKSGRGIFREPSLTPITERSEWSTRNSIISVSAHGVAHYNQSVSSPGLAQLVDLNSIEDEMSLSALMKLRRDAWGGSNGSLRSSSASPPPQQYPASNRGSLVLSDVSPTVQTAPPDFLESPVRESAWAYPLPQQRTERAGDGEPQG